MGEQQPLRVGPPKKDDTGLLDFSAMLQKDFEVLFDFAHSHRIRTTAPTSREGLVGDIVLVDLGATKYIAVKYSGGWFKTSAMTAV